MLNGPVKKWHVLAAAAVTIISLGYLSFNVIDFIWGGRAPVDQGIEATSAGLSASPLVSFPKVPSTFDDGSPRQTPEFEAMARRAFEQGHPRFFSRRVIGELEQLLGSPELPLPQRLEFSGHLVQALLNEGSVDEAVQQIEALAALSQQVGVEPSANFHRLRGLVYLRQAEVQNCIVRHNAECCVFPLAGGGVHSQREPAEHARASYLKFLELAPGNLYGRWMLNIIAMALGEHPQGLPAEHLIPPTAFDSQHDIGRFPDIAAKVGVDTFNHAGGAIAQDIDNDGLLDIVTSTIGLEHHMTYCHNDGDGRFNNRSAASRLDDQYGGLNCNAVDYDNDGDIDILVLRGGWMEDDGRMRKSLLRNDGQGVFTDVTRAAGLAEPAFPTQTAVWADFDHDGDLDLYAGHESRVEGRPAAGDYPCSLLLNGGPPNWTFTDIAEAAGVTNDRYTKGVAAGDYDNDGDMDIYVSNIGRNRLYRNDGNLKFTDVASEAGVTGPEGYSFATWFFDYDNDGWLDLWVGAYDAAIDDIAADYLGMEHHASLPQLYRNNGNGTFTSVTESMGLNRPWRPMGANFGDLDNDGWLDIYLATGAPEYDMLMPNIMLRNDAGKRYQDVTKSGGFGHLQKGHGVAFADFDNDGDQDVFNQLGGFYPGDGFRNALYQNPGHRNHFITIELAGIRSNRMAVGARIELVLDTPGGPREIHRAAGCVSSFGGSPARQEIGLGDAALIKRLEIHWPASGTTQVFENVPLDSFLRIEEGNDSFGRLLPRRVKF